MARKPRKISGKAAGPSETALVRREAALELRIKGRTYRQIAAELGVGRDAAWKAVDAALRDQLERNDEKAEHLRELELERLDVATAALFSGVKSGSTKAIMALMAVMGRRARLVGLDQPERVQVVEPDEYEALTDAQLLARYKALTAKRGAAAAG